MDVEARAVVSKKEELGKDKAEQTHFFKKEEREEVGSSEHTRLVHEKMQVMSDSHVVSAIQHILCAGVERLTTGRNVSGAIFEVDFWCQLGEILPSM